MEFEEHPQLERHAKALTLGVKSLMAVRGWSQSTFADKLGKKQAQVSKWLSHGSRAFGRNEWFIIASANLFGLRVDEMYRRGYRLLEDIEMEAARRRIESLATEPERDKVLESLNHLTVDDRKAVREAISDIDGPEDS